MIDEPGAVGADLGQQRARRVLVDGAIHEEAHVAWHALVRQQPARARRRRSCRGRARRLRRQHQPALPLIAHGVDVLLAPHLPQLEARQTGQTVDQRIARRQQHLLRRAVAIDDAVLGQRPGRVESPLRAIGQPLRVARGEVGQHGRPIDRLARRGHAGDAVAVGDEALERRSAIERAGRTRQPVAQEGATEVVAHARRFAGILQHREHAAHRQEGARQRGVARGAVARGHAQLELLVERGEPDVVLRRLYPRRRRRPVEVEVGAGGPTTQAATVQHQAQRLPEIAEAAALAQAGAAAGVVEAVLPALGGRPCDHAAGDEPGQRRRHAVVARAVAARRIEHLEPRLQEPPLVFGQRRGRERNRLEQAERATEALRQAA